MSRLYRNILDAIQGDRVIVSFHADEQCEERGVTPWQLAAMFQKAELLRERPASRPNPSIVVRQMLADGSTVETVWAWLSRTGRAKLVTVYFQD